MSKGNRMTGFMLAVMLVVSFTSCMNVQPRSAGNNLPENSGAYSDVETSEPDAYIEKSYLLPGFSTHLPLIAVKFMQGSQATAENNRFNNLSISVYDSHDRNSLANEPVSTITAEGQLLENYAPAHREKHDYFLRFYDDSGEKAAHSLLGLSAGSQYYLLGAMFDRSLLRNYLGYTLMGQIRDGTPGVRFCEVVLDLGEKGYLYQGVYLLVEDCPDDNAVLRVLKHSAEGTGVFLDTFGWERYPEDGRFEVPLSDMVEDETVLWDLAGNLSAIEQVIYSDNLDTFSGYKDLIDIDSFVDFFIINEVMGNYSAKHDAYYSYNIDTNTLAMGPVWNFETSLDNTIETPMEVDEIQFSEGGYFERILKSRAFLERLQKRYRQLRTDVLNEDNFNKLIDEALAYLGPAVTRDWWRWSYYYNVTDGVELQPVAQEPLAGTGQTEEAALARSAQNHQQELIRIRYLLREHDIYTAYAIAYLDADLGPTLHGAEAAYVRNTWLFLLFLAVLALVVHYVRRYAE